RLFATRYSVVGFDTDNGRVAALREGRDITRETDSDALLSVLKSAPGPENGLFISGAVEDISSCNHYIVTVPTPVDLENQPDLTQLRQASETVGRVLQRGDIVIYESTVYP